MFWEQKLNPAMLLLELDLEMQEILLELTLMLSSSR
jgi:hypothetical protein